MAYIIQSFSAHHHLPCVADTLIVSISQHVCLLSHFSRVWFFAIQWTVTYHSSVYGILQARGLEWVVMTSSRRSSQPRDRTQVSCTAGSLLHCRWILYQLSHQGSPTEPPGKVRLHTEQQTSHHLAIAAWVPLFGVKSLALHNWSLWFRQESHQFLVIVWVLSPG